MITGHSIDRIHERVGLNARAAARMIDLAEKRGKTASEFSHKEQNYIKRIENINNSTVRVYSGYIFIFIEDTCITMFPVPNWFGKKSHYTENQPIRNIKKYTRYMDNSYAFYN